MNQCIHPRIVSRQFATIVAVAAALLVAACSPVDDGGESEPVTEEDPGIAEDEGQEEATQPEDNTLRIATGADMPTLDPHYTETNQMATVTSLIFHNLFIYDTNNQIAPQLATDWGYTDEGDQFWVEIEEEHEFSNGDPLDAQAVVDSFERLLDPDEATARAGLFGAIEEVTLDDDGRVLFTTQEPFSHMEALLAGPNARIVHAETARDPESEYGQSPVGSGPFEVTEYIGTELVRIEPREGWDGQEPLVDAIEWHIVPEDSGRIALLETGEVDMVHNVPPTQLDAVNDLPNASVEEVEGTMSVSMELNQANEPVDDPAVRSALNLAIDRDAMIENLLGGLGVEPVTIPGIGTQDHLRAELEPKEYDPERAQEMLEEAGYEDGLELHFRCPRGRYIQDEAACEAIQGYLQAIGVNAEIESMEWAAYIDAVNGPPPEEREDHGALLGRANLDIDYVLYRLYHSEIDTNVTSYENPDVDTLLDAGRVSFDDDEQEEIYTEIQEILWEEEPTIPLWYEIQAFGVADRVGGEYHIYPWESMELMNVELD